MFRSSPKSSSTSISRNDQGHSATTAHSLASRAPSPIRAFAFMAALLALPFLFLSPITGAAYAQNEIELRTGNDFLAGNSRSDDLYTAGLAITYEFQRAKIGDQWLGRGYASLEENLFTDRDAGVRFDETWLVLGRRFEKGDTRYGVYGGLVRAGEGLFGERLQNAVHSAIGGDDVDLEYVPDNEHFPVLGANIRTHLFSSKRWTSHVHGEARIAQGFKQSLRVGFEVEWRLTNWLELFGGIGAQATWAEYDLLEPWVEPLDMTAELGIAFKQRIVLSWSDNAYGTGMGHTSLAYRIPVSTSQKGSR